MLKVTASHPTHHYHRCLYEHMLDRVVELKPDGHEYSEEDILRLALTSDIFHLHWPENMYKGDREKIIGFITRLKQSGIKIVWTLHNLLPHRNLKDGERLYAEIASMADGAIHHSEWGKNRAIAALPFKSNCIHRTIFHGHFRSIIPTDIRLNRFKFRKKTEREYGLHPTRIRLGIIGSPRNGKMTEEFISVFKTVPREDVGLFNTSASSDAPPPSHEDHRITSIPYSFIDRDVFYRRLAAIDLLILPFSPDTRMLTTGVIADAIAMGIPCARTSWGYLAETLGSNAIFMGDTPTETRHFLESLSQSEIKKFKRKISKIEPIFNWKRLARDTESLFYAVVSAHQETFKA